MIRSVLGLGAAVLILSSYVMFRSDRPLLAPDVGVTRAADPFPAEIPARDALALRRTAAALSDLSELLGPEPAPAVGPQTGPVAVAKAPVPALPVPGSTEALKATLAQAFAEGRDEDEIHRLIDAATARPGVDMPDRLMTASGLVHLARFRDPAGRSHTVAPGDTLGSIAEQFYGAPGAYLRIVEANAAAFSASGRLETGQVLMIPD
ncbi:LysM peptidoglycan-binding domain-containing protein [Roseisalinus antarcticus]|uniref:LysM domain/BON superfamily protein n=1 Tax=Roseisalinus antarcticus TaxID=254357 RepID=A0A1Y5T8P5_9RHOB|nr:LysM peptidoglycan-binding domain-containing protein [Roseisalinus antarcticus]SLN58201.1 LysM domain/BON superfamily protein [Roseisalinus antarcticus]